MPLPASSCLIHDALGQADWADADGFHFQKLAATPERNGVGYVSTVDGRDTECGQGA